MTLFKLAFLARFELFEKNKREEQWVCFFKCTLPEG